MTDRTKIYRHIRDRFAGDGPPHWSQRNGKFVRPCQTATEADSLRQKQVRQLRKAAADEARIDRQAALRGIADDIDACRPKWRSWCRHPACPCCIRSLQRWFVWTAPVAAKRAAKSRDPQELSFLSLIPPLRLTPGSSPAHIKKQVAALLAKLNNTLTEAGVTFVLGGFDVSVNIDLDGEERLQPQLWACGLRAELERASSALREAFPASETTPRPVLIRPYDGNVGAFAYATKNEFNQRASLAPSAQEESNDRDNVDGADRWATTRPGSRAPDKRNTRNKSLTIAQGSEAALFLDALGSDRRLFLSGFRVERNKNGEAVIRPTAEAMTEAERRANELSHVDASRYSSLDGDADKQPDDHGYGADGEPLDDGDRAWFEGRHHCDAEGEQELDDDADRDEDDGEEWDDNEWDEDTEDESEGDGERQTRPVQRDPIAQRLTDEANLKAWVNTWADHYRAQARMRGQELSDAQVIELLEARLKAMPRT